MSKTMMAVTALICGISFSAAAMAQTAPKQTQTQQGQTQMPPKSSGCGSKAVTS